MYIFTNRGPHLDTISMVGHCVHSEVYVNDGTKYVLFNTGGSQYSDALQEDKYDTRSISLDSSTKVMFHTKDNFIKRTKYVDDGDYYMDAKNQVILLKDGHGYVVNRDTVKIGDDILDFYPTILNFENTILHLQYHKKSENVYLNGELVCNISEHITEYEAKNIDVRTYSVYDIPNIKNAIISIETTNIKNIVVAIVSTAGKRPDTDHSINNITIDHVLLNSDTRTHPYYTPEQPTITKGVGDSTNEVVDVVESDEVLNKVANVKKACLESGDVYIYDGSGYSILRHVGVNNLGMCVVSQLEIPSGS